MIRCIPRGSCVGKAVRLHLRSARTRFGRSGTGLQGFCFSCGSASRTTPGIDLLKPFLFSSPNREVAESVIKYLVGHVVRVRNLVRVGGEGVVVTEDVLLDGLVHVSADGKQMFRTIFVPHHLLNPSPIPQQPLLVPLVALKGLLVPVLLLCYFFVHHLYALGKRPCTFWDLVIYSMSCCRSA